MLLAQGFAHIAAGGIRADSMASVGLLAVIEGARKDVQFGCSYTTFSATARFYSESGSSETAHAQDPHRVWLGLAGIAHLQVTGLLLTRCLYHFLCFARYILGLTTAPGFGVAGKTIKHPKRNGTVAFQLSVLGM